MAPHADGLTVSPNIRVARGSRAQVCTPPQGLRAVLSCHAYKKSARSSFGEDRAIDLATTYFHRTYRPTIIGAAAFHFRVRNGTGWFHRAVVTRGEVLRGL